VQPTIAEQLPTSANILIIGCGQGAEATAMIANRPDINTIVGIDVSPAAIDKARKNVTDPRVTFLVQDVFTMKQDMAGQSFDFILSIQNFEHWKPELHPEAFRNIWTRLKPGGSFFFTGVGRKWSLDITNSTPMEYEGKTYDMENDRHYMNWSEQDFYDLAMTQKPKSVTFWRLRRENRVVAEVKKA
jgi:2-polyprenyl-3-methyl-5-hydroxy-6-metoxy-1,4-benzoquinol methylase